MLAIIFSPTVQLVSLKWKPNLGTLLGQKKFKGWIYDGFFIDLGQEGSSISRQNLNEYIGTLHLTSNTISKLKKGVLKIKIASILLLISVPLLS